MVNIRSPKETDHRRRHFVATAALTVAAQLGMTNAVVAHPRRQSRSRSNRDRTHPSVR